MSQHGGPRVTVWRAMAQSFEGKKVFITGGSGTIGRALCTRFAERGATVAFSYFSGHEGVDATVGAVQRVSGKEPLVLRANLHDADAPAQLAGELLGKWDSLDVFISNAASGVLKPTQELTAKHWDWCLGINARSFLLLANALGPRINAGGRVLALSSYGATKAIPLYAAIGASKAALESIVRNLALEMGPRRITVNAISPGIVETQALDYFPNKEELIRIAKLKTAMGRLVTPDDVADVAEFLASPLADMIHGQTLHVDGGYSILA